jgi:hypothetical protein
MTRSDGMHAQMIPTLISMLDQWMTSAWSQVGFKEEPKLMRDCRRSADTTVTLGLGVSMLEKQGLMECLQGADEKHHSNTDLATP